MITAGDNSRIENRVTRVLVLGSGLCRACLVRNVAHDFCVFDNFPSEIFLCKKLQVIKSLQKRQFFYKIAKKALQVLGPNTSYKPLAPNQFWQTRPEVQFRHTSPWYKRCTISPKTAALSARTISP